MAIKNANNHFLFLFFALAILIPSVSAEKYLEWYYWYNRPSEPTLSTIENGVCKDVFDAYRNASSNGATSVTINGAAQCYLVEDCVLANLRESFIANYQAAAVVLGILPTLLATLGPRIGEISLLSTTRPVLSSLISIGAPAVWPTRVFEYDDPSSSLGKGVNRRVMQPQSAGRARILSIIQYMLVCGAIVNILQVAITLGQKTVLSWSCEFSYAPLIFGLIPIFIHGLAAISYHFEVRQAEKQAFVDRERRLSGPKSPEPGLMTPPSAPLSENPLSRRTTFIAQRKRMPFWQRELTICANQPRGLATLLKERKLPWFAVLFNCIASLMAFFHLFFGTMIFSSLTFISVYDILNFVFWRYILSTVICRLVLLIELMGMREEDVKDVEKVAEVVTSINERLRKVESSTSPLISPRGSNMVGGVEEFEMKKRPNTTVSSKKSISHQDQQVDRRDHA